MPLGQAATHCPLRERNPLLQLVQLPTQPEHVRQDDSHLSQLLLLATERLPAGHEVTQRRVEGDRNQPLRQLRQRDGAVQVAQGDKQVRQDMVRMSG